MNRNQDFEAWSPEYLNTELADFYRSVRKADGGYYSKNSLYNLRAMINKHLKEKVKKRFDIVVDEKFK